MPNMADISLKDKDGLTVTAKQLVASAGDKTPARWRIEPPDWGLSDYPPAYYPAFAAQSRFNTAKDVRRVDISMDFLYAVKPDGLVIPVSKNGFTCSWALSQQVDSSVARDHVAFLQSFIASELVKQVLLSGYAPV